MPYRKKRGHVLKIEVPLPKQENNVWLFVLVVLVALIPCIVDLHEIHLNAVSKYLFVSCNMFCR